MSKQQDLHARALKRLADLERIIDQLKAAGPCRLNRWNALLNTREWLVALAGRCDLERTKECRRFVCRSAF